MKKVIVTVGASIFSNNLGSSTHAYRYYDSLKGKKATTDWAASENKVDRLRAELWNQIKNTDEPKVAAELQSLHTLINQAVGVTEAYLIASDTVLSRLAAELILDWLAAHPFKLRAYFDPAKDVIKGMQVKDGQQFRKEGIQNLTGRLRAIQEENSKGEFLINISGGYKATLPVLTIYAQLYKLKLVYQYEDSTELLEIDPMPLNFDWSVIEQDISFLLAPETIQLDSKPAKRLKEKHLIQREGDGYRHTVMGALLADYATHEDTPFINTILGYVVELKLWELLKKQSPKAEIEAGYVPKCYRGVKGKEWEDIDLLIKDSSAETFTACEIKPSSHINKAKFTKLIRKLCTRAQEAERDFEFSVSELWVILYSVDKDNIPAIDETITAIREGESIIKTDMGRNTPLFIKHFHVSPNVVNGKDDRISYHQFLRTSLADDTLKENYYSPQLGQSPS